MVCHYWFFNHGFKFQDSICNSCRDVAMLCLNISSIINIAVKGLDYHCIIRDVSKSETIHLLDNYVLDDRSYI